MKILIIHNQYKQAGGEDSVFRAESELLRSYGHEVQQVLYDNSIIKSFLDKCLSGLKSLYNPDSAHVVRLKIKDFQPDVIHVHNFLPIVSPSVLFAAKKSRIPVVMTLHNYRLICPSATLFFKGKIYEKSLHTMFPIDAVWNGVYRNSKLQTAVVVIMTSLHNVIGTWRNKVDCYIALTQFAKAKFEISALKIASQKIMVKPNFVMDSGSGAITRDDFFLFVGRLTEEKGIETLLSAANKHTFTLVIIGDGPLKKVVENSALGNTNIHFLGHQSTSIVMDHLKRCKALIFPSVWYEGFPVIIAEAFSTGAPVIASKLGSMMEIIQHGVNGLHVKPGNDLDLISKIKEMIEDRVMAKKMSDHARLSYLQHYTPAKNYDQLMDIYTDAINRNKSISKIRILQPARA